MMQRLQTQWYSYFRLAIVYAFIFQISIVFDDLWYDRTFTMLAYILFISAAIHIVLDRFHDVIKLFLDFLVCIILGIGFSNRWERYADSIDLTFAQKLASTFADAWQFYSIGLCVLLIAKIVLFAVNTRLQHSMFFTLGLILVLIVDSFSPIVLWMHAIVIICLFLLWHMCWHYEHIRRNNEDEFEVILNSPASIFTPFVAVISVAIVVALLLPYGPPLLEDPYALWKKSRGEEVPAFLGDKGFRSITPNSGNKQSGYRRSSDVLGGGFDFNYETVMEIVTPQKSYWRGETINYYNGLGWIDTIQNNTSSEILPHEQLEFKTDRPLATLKEIEIRVNVQQSTYTSFPVLFHASEVKQLNEVVYTLEQPSLSSFRGNQPGINQVPSINVTYDETNKESLPGITQLQKDNTIAFDLEANEVSYPIVYSMTSEVLQLDIEKLVTTQSKHEDPTLQRLYTELPASLPQEVRDLASLITSEAESDYERAKLLENYLKLNYAYDNRPNEKLLSGEEDDFVYKFLFELYEGYCDYFSTAMAVMAKSLGMPARWVKGFAPGINENEQYMQQIPMSFEEAEKLQLELGGGTYTVRNADAHSWVEIYFEGFGWIAFEPTPGFQIPYENISDDSELAYIDEPQQLEDTAPQEPYASQGSFSGGRLLVILLFVLLAVLIVIIIIRRVLINGNILDWRFKHLSNNDQIVYKFNSFLRYCERRGLKRAKGETAREALLKFEHGSKHWRNMLEELYSLFELARYSSGRLNRKHVQKVNELIKSLKKQWKI